MNDNRLRGKGAIDAGAENVLQFETPENVVFGYLVAGIGSRFLAAVVDTFLIVLLQLVVNLTLIFLVAILAGDRISALGDETTLSFLAGIIGLVAFAFLWGYYIFFELVWNGQTPGKKWVGLRVILANGSPIDLPAALIRNLVRIVDFLPLYYGIGVLSMFIDSRSRRLGDFAASTLVVYDRGTVTLETLAKESQELERSLNTNPLQVSPQGPRLPRNQLQPQHVALAQRFLSRRPELRNSHELSILLAQRLLAELGVTQQDLDAQQASLILKQIAGHQQVPGDHDQDSLGLQPPD